MNTLSKRQKLSTETERELDEVVNDMLKDGWRVVRRWMDTYSSVAVFEK